MTEGAGIREDFEREEVVAEIGRQGGKQFRKFPWSRAAGSGSIWRSRYKSSHSLGSLPGPEAETAKWTVF